MVGRPRLERPTEPVKIYLDKNHLFIAKKYHIDFRALMIEAFDKAIYAYIGGEEHLEEEVQKIINAELKYVEDMIEFIKLGVATGKKTRPQMEVDFGKMTGIKGCFPEPIWRRYGHSDAIELKLRQIEDPFLERLPLREGVF